MAPSASANLDIKEQQSVNLINWCLPLGLPLGLNLLEDLFQTLNSLPRILRYFVGIVLDGEVL